MVHPPHPGPTPVGFGPPTAAERASPARIGPKPLPGRTSTAPTGRRGQSSGVGLTARAVKRGGLDGPGQRHATMDREARQGFSGAPLAGPAENPPTPPNPVLTPVSVRYRGSGTRRELQGLRVGGARSSSDWSGCGITASSDSSSDEQPSRCRQQDEPESNVQPNPDSSPQKIENGGCGKKHTKDHEDRPKLGFKDRTSNAVPEPASASVASHQV